MFHFQNSVRDWPRAVAQLPNGSLIKSIDRGDILRDVKAINPNIKTALRHYGGTQNIFDGRGFEAYKNVARQFFSEWIDGTFRAQYARHTDIAIEWNEYLASSHTGAELQDRIDWARAAAWVWKNEYRTQADYAHIRLGLLSCPVGNDIHRAFAEIALQYDCVLSYHAYDKFIGDHQRDPQSWRYHCGRWAYMEEVWGLKPTWMFGEAGPYHGVLEGWRHSKVLNGDTAAYVEAVRRWIREIKQTPAYREGRVLGFNLFTTGGTNEWEYYETRQPEMDRLAAMIAEEWQPVAPPPPPPPPPEPEPRRYARTYHLLPQDARPDEVDAVVQEAYGPKQTVGFSVDDAFVDAEELTKRTVHVWEVARIVNLPDPERELETWVTTFHPPLPEIRYRRVADLFVADRWDSPVGNKLQREGALWPPGWEDANPFLNHYVLGYHTGVDLNNNAVVWDYDRNMPVYAAASGRVTYAGMPNNAWQRVVVMEHRAPDGTRSYSRYAHLGDIVVGEGQWLRRGQMLGIVGRNMTDEGPGPFHLHFDVSHTTALLANPGHWPGENRQGVVDNYREPKAWIEARR